jgi:hypothetical protein
MALAKAKERAGMASSTGRGNAPASPGEAPRCRNEPLRASELIDGSLVSALGQVDAATGEAIAGICNDALRDVLSPAVISAVLADHRLLPMVAPWVLDLARGLQFRGRELTPEPATADLITRLGGPGISAADARRLAETADLAAVLNLGRVLEQVLGPGAAARDPRANETAAPWLRGLKLGFRIYLVQEALRLLPQWGTDICP